MLDLNADFILEIALHHLWQGGVVAASVWALLQVFRRWSAETRYRLWTAALILIGILPLLAVMPRPSVTQGNELWLVASAPNASTAIPSEAQRSRSFTNLEVGPAEAAYPTVPKLSSLLAALWAVGVIWRLVTSHRAAATLRGWRNNARLEPLGKLPLPPEAFGNTKVYYSQDVSTPLVAGFFTPCILLPTVLRGDLEPSELEHVLLHELAHIRRGDPLLALMQCLIEAVYFFNPIVHWVSHRVRTERECSCDDRALRASNEDGPSYAACLVKVTKYATRPYAPAVAVGAIRHPSELARRVDRLLSRSGADDTRGSWAAVIASTAALLALAVGLSSTVPRIGAAQPVEVAATSNEPSNAGRRALGRALVEAAARGDSGTVEALIESGADVDYRLMGDGTPLIVAARSGRHEIVEMLLTAGADVNRSVSGDGNPLIMAAARGRLSIVATLVEHEADVNAIVTGDETPLINAAANGHLDVVEYLVARGADVNLAILANPGSRQELRSPLNQAVKRNHGAVATYLRDHGATQ